MGKKESQFQNKLIKEIMEERLPGSIAFKVETYIQGFSDVIVLYGKQWAILECKREQSAAKQKNQDYYVNKFNEMSFSRFVYPENKEEVLDELQRAFGLDRETRSI